MTLENMEIVKDIFYHKPLGSHTHEREKEEKARRERVLKDLQDYFSKVKIKLPTMAKF